VSLAHHGVLFLDEMPEFNKDVLEVLRQPMEDGHVTIARAALTLTFPARFMLIGAMNPCPCGYLGDTQKACTCPPSIVSRYRRRISGPMLDRIDIFADVPRVDYEKLTDERAGEPSAAVRERVAAARVRQERRFRGTSIICNAEMGPVEVREFCQGQLEEPARSLVRLAVNQLGLSARAFHRVLKVARTIADLAGSQAIATAHVAEAIQYRQRGVG
jgi:magnesium chelatase family protein